jgi:hypothetical protein
MKRFSLKVVLLKNGSVAPTIELRLHPRRGKTRLIINPLLPVVPNAPLSTACTKVQAAAWAPPLDRDPRERARERERREEGERERQQQREEKEEEERRKRVRVSE